jgi:hypothetical protein
MNALLGGNKNSGQGNSGSNALSGLASSLLGGGKHSGGGGGNSAGKLVGQLASSFLNSGSSNKPSHQQQQGQGHQSHHSGGSGSGSGQQSHQSQQGLSGIMGGVSNFLGSKPNSQSGGVSNCPIGLLLDMAANFRKGSVLTTYRTTAIHTRGRVAATRAQLLLTTRPHPPLPSHTSPRLRQQHRASTKEDLSTRRTEASLTLLRLRATGQLMVLLTPTSTTDSHTALLIPTNTKDSLTAHRVSTNTKASSTRTTPHSRPRARALVHTPSSNPHTARLVRVPRISSTLPLLPHSSTILRLPEVSRATTRSTSPIQRSLVNTNSNINPHRLLSQVMPRLMEAVPEGTVTSPHTRASHRMARPRLAPTVANREVMVQGTKTAGCIRYPVIFQPQ